MFWAHWVSLNLPATKTRTACHSPQLILLVSLYLIWNLLKQILLHYLNLHILYFLVLFVWAAAVLAPRSVSSSVSIFHLQISAVRLPREPSNPERLKGFGYAEFDDVDSLLRALSLNEEVRQWSTCHEMSEIKKKNVCSSAEVHSVCSCQQNLGNRRIRVDIADQSNDKGWFMI